MDSTKAAAAAAANTTLLPVAGRPRGRHLVANTHIEKGRLIFCERPLLALQSLENQKYVSICHCCKAFLGGPDYALKHRRRGQQRQEEDHSPKEQSASTAEAAKHPNDSSSSPLPFQVVPCRLACGHHYCSSDCEADAWHAFHSHLCTGKCHDKNSPLVKLKQFAVDTNEILLLVAEWWVAQHTSSYLENEQAAAAAKRTKGDTSAIEEGHSASSFSSSSYTDFVMEPWWDVVRLDHSNTKKNQEDGGGGREEEAEVLQTSLKQICQDAADLLQQVFAADAAADESSSSSIRIPPISALDIAKRIGACEQNAMGIRQRNPLCRNVLEDADLRQRRHDEIVHCLVESGFIGHDDDDDGDDGEEEESTEAKPQKETAIDDANKVDQPEKTAADEEWDYSVEEIATFLAGLFMDEEGTVRDVAHSSKKGKNNDDNGDEISRERDTVGDDLDYIFLPLDGTAMYATACKMNHSCDPNVIVMYRSKRGWGWHYPLTAYCVALKEISPNEELTISYIESDMSYEQRSQALAIYGFHCSCATCEKEKNGECYKAVQDPEATEDLFGGGDDDDDEDADDHVNIAGIANGDIGDHQEHEPDGDTTLEQRLERLDTAMNHTRYASIPLTMHGRVAAFVIHKINNGCFASSGMSASDDKRVIHLLQMCSRGLQLKDFSLCKTVGCDLEETLYSLLRKHSSWPSVQHREAYWCAALTAAVGYSHDCSFLKAQNALDKAVILGLSIKGEAGINEFVQYVECHATETSIGPYPPCTTSTIPNYQESSLIPQLSDEALSRPIGCPILERPTNEITVDLLLSDFVSNAAPLVLRNFAIEWRALDRWHDLQYLAKCYGHRLVPIELGSMMTGEMVEKLATFRDFIHSFLVPSTAKSFWSLEEAVSGPQKIAYLAQHPLLDQISSLQFDVDMKPALCGEGGPSHVYLWIGTGGTRTPLHFDSYDNLFVQLAGAKFVRIYSREETPRLYVSAKSVYGLQGNMSELDCEREDWTKHPLAKDAAFQEVLLLPGDALFIPSRTWHYVRSLSTSISVNYWF
jgi:Cupin-like domain/SET domain